MTLIPWLDWLRTASTPDEPSRAVSTGWVTSVSTSSGDRPGHSVRMTTRGRSRSGKTSIGIRVDWYPPYTRATKLTARTRVRWVSEKRMMASNMVARLLPFVLVLVQAPVRVDVVPLGRGVRLRLGHPVELGGGRLGDEQPGRERSVVGDHHAVALGDQD